MQILGAGRVGHSYEIWAEAGDFALSLRGGIASKWMSC
jgi:hypothetical protein